MQRQILPYSVTFLVLILVVGFAYFSRNPDSPWLEQAQEWPVVGELAQRFRLAYLGPDETGPDETGPDGARTEESGAQTPGTDSVRAATPATNRAPSRPRPAARRATPPPPTEPLHLPELTRMPVEIAPEQAQNVDAASNLGRST